MVSEKILNNVLRMITAGKEPSSIPVKNPTVPEHGTQAHVGKEAPVPATPEKQIPPYTRRYYYYLAPKEMSINFEGIYSILKSESEDTRGEKDSLIKKLQGGNTGAYHADYFQWKKIVIATNQYSRGEEKIVVYECGLNMDGRKSAGTEKVSPNNIIPARQIEADLAIYKMDGARQVINLDTSSDSIYINAEPPTNIARLAMTKGFMPQNKAEQYKDFVQIFDQYRIWVGQGNVGGLRMPDGSQPKEDDVQGGYYQGGEEVFNRIVGPFLQKIEQTPQQLEHPLADKSEDAHRRNVFKAVGAPEKPVKGDIIDEPSGSPMTKKYSEDYKIRRMARNVIADYLEKDDPEKEALTTGQTVRGIGQYEKPSEEFKAKAEKSRQQAKLYDNMAQQLAKFDKFGK